MVAKKLTLGAKKVYVYQVMAQIQTCQKLAMCRAYLHT
jgi:hypothetical protein